MCIRAALRPCGATTTGSRVTATTSGWSWTRRDTLRSSSSSAGVSAGVEPRQPKSSGAVRIERTRVDASRSVTGISRWAMSPRSCEAAPASPNDRTAPAAGSITARTTVSTPRGAMAWTTGRSSSGLPNSSTNSA